MVQRFEDGSAGDANYGDIGKYYSQYRRPEPKIADTILKVLGSAESVLNIGAGAGSYEPLDRRVTAVEPSASMRKQRPEYLTPAVNAFAENLPFPDKSFDASMSVSSVHQWQDLEKGLEEMRRVTRGPVVILYSEPSLLQKFWLNDYAPKVLEAEAKRFPSAERMSLVLGKGSETIPVMIPLDCSDGFNEAYYGRPEKFLDPRARLSCSSWNCVEEEIAISNVSNLQIDLESGKWDEKYGYLRSTLEYEGSVRLFVAH